MRLLIIIPFVVFFVNISCQDHPKNSPDFLFTIGASREIPVQEDFAVFVTLEESLNPVTFNLSFVWDYSPYLKSPTIQLTLSPGEARKVPIQVKDKEYFLRNNRVLTKVSFLTLKVTAFQPGIPHGKIYKDSTSLSIHVNEEYHREPDKNGVIVQVDNDHQIYKPGMDINYRVLVMENRYQLLQGPFLVKSELVSVSDKFINSDKVLWKEETPAVVNGLLTGSAKILPGTERLKVTVEGESLFEAKSETLAQSNHRQDEKQIEKDELKVRVEYKKDLPIYGAKTNVTISMFRSLTKIPVLGSCSLGISRYIYSCGDPVSSKNFTLEWESGGRHQMELNIAKELDLYKEFNGGRKFVKACLKITCTDLLTGEINKSDFLYKRMVIYKNISTIDFLSNEIQGGSMDSNFNSVALTLRIGRKDGDELSSGQLELILELSPDTLTRLKHRKETHFRKNISTDGIVVVEFEVKDGTTFTDEDKFLVRFGDAEQVYNLTQTPQMESPSLEIVLAAPEKPVRIGQVTKFYVISKYKLDENIYLNAVLHSIVKQYEIKRVKVNPERYGTRGIIAEVEFVIPKQVYTRQGLRLTVYGSCQPNLLNQKDRMEKCIFSGAMTLTDLSSL